MFDLTFDDSLWGGSSPVIDSGGSGGGDFFGLGIDSGGSGVDDYFGLGLNDGIWTQDFGGPTSGGPVVSSESGFNWSPIVDAAGNGLNAAINLWTQDRQMDMRQDWLNSQLEYYRAMNQIERPSNTDAGRVTVVRQPLPSWMLWGAVGLGAYLLYKAV